MRTRTGRFLLLFLLLIVGSGATVFAGYLSRQIDDLSRAGRANDVRVERLLGTFQQISEAQQLYIVPSATERPTAEQVPALIAAVVTEIAEIEPHVRAERSRGALTIVVEKARALEQFEARAQEHVRLGQEFMAADVISVGARDARSAVNAALLSLRSEETSVIETQRSALLQQTWMAIGGAAVVWLLGLFALVGVPRTRPAPETATAPAILSLSEPQQTTRNTTASATDLARAADLCTAIARIADARDLPPLLTRASAVLGASGVVVWMTAGDELIAASAHGYDARAMSRLGPIHRTALNATAAAWRKGAMQTVAGEGASRGALVAPMLGTDRCIGVLAVEVPHGRETDGATQAITRFLAAQLAATLAPWPAASVADPHASSFENAAKA